MVDGLVVSYHQDADRAGESAKIAQNLSRFQDCRLPLN